MVSAGTGWFLWVSSQTRRKWYQLLFESVPQFVGGFKEERPNTGLPLRPFWVLQPQTGSPPFESPGTAAELQHREDQRGGGGVGVLAWNAPADENARASDGRGTEILSLCAVATWRWEDNIAHASPCKMHAGPTKKHQAH